MATVTHIIHGTLKLFEWQILKKWFFPPVEVIRTWSLIFRTFKSFEGQLIPQQRNPEVSLMHSEDYLYIGHRK